MFFVDSFILKYILLGRMGRDFHKLKIFNLSYAFLLDVYRFLPNLPEFEFRNIFSQLQRAATSVVLNIVEGSSSMSNKVFLNHLNYSYGSCKEVEVLLLLCFDLGYIEKDLFSDLSSCLEELKASLFLFMRSVDKEIFLKKNNYALV